MKISEDPHSADWIIEGRLRHEAPFESDAWSCKIENLIPPRYESYVKIFHWLEASYANIDNPLSREENSILGIPECQDVRRFIETHRARSTERRFRWREIAEWLGVQFQAGINHEWFRERLRPSPECWPRHIVGPADGLLRPKEREELARVLGLHTRKETCFFRFSEIPFIGTDKPLLFDGRLEELNGFLIEHRYQFSPEYWWPRDRSWCVCTDYDLTFTIVGGPTTLTQDILESEILEAITVTANTRVDSRMPMPK